MPSSPGSSRFALGLVLLMVLGSAARLAHVEEILGPGGPHLIPTDSHYYLRFAQLQSGAFPGFVRFDPLVNFPTGAEVLWPPLHTWLVGALQRLAAPATPDVGTVWTGPVASALWLLLLALLGRRRLGPEGTLWLVATLALAPLAIAAGQLGDADHHVHEAPLVAVTLLCAWRASGAGGWRAGLALGVCLGVARLLTTSGFLLAPVAAFAFPVGALLRRSLPGGAPDPGAGNAGAAPRTLAGPWHAGAVALVVAAGLQGLSALAWGSPASLDYTQLGAFHPLWTCAWFGAALALTGLLERDAGRPGRWRSLLGASALSVGCALSLGPTVLSGLGDAARTDAVLMAAAESNPLWGDWRGALSLWGPGWWLWAGALGAGLASLNTAARGARLAHAGGMHAATRWTGDATTAGLLRALLIALPLLPLSLVQVRLARPGLGALALTLALGMPALRALLAARVRPAVRRAFWGLSALTALLLLIPRGPAVPHEEKHLRPTLRWLAAHTPAPGMNPDHGVLTPWTFGHLVTAWAGRPSLATPFSQAPVHEEANARALAILAETDESRAFALARESRLRYVLATPYHGTVGPKEREHLGMAARLLEDAGLAERGPEGASAHFRLLHESREERNRPQGGPLARIFEIVPGAELSGLTSPLGTVELRLTLESERGSHHAYVRRTRADETGRWSLRAAYPTARDPHATVQARGAYALHCGSIARKLELELAHVREGSRLQVGDCRQSPSTRALDAP